MNTLLDRIVADADERGLPATVVFLGDLVNRGAASKDVLDRLLAGPDRREDSWIVLRGNHEQIMIDALTGAEDAAFSRWLRMGGMATLESYGGSRKHARADRARTLIDATHLDFLQALPLMHRHGNHVFVHAGIEPGIPLTRQRAERLLTIRGRFLRRHHGLPVTVVHGHTPSDGRPILAPGRIGIDTGAYLTGILTALAIDPWQSAPRFLQATAATTQRRSRVAC